MISLYLTCGTCQRAPQQRRSATVAAGEHSTSEVTCQWHGKRLYKLQRFAHARETFLNLATKCSNRHCYRSNVLQIKADVAMDCQSAALLSARLLTNAVKVRLRKRCTLTRTTCGRIPATFLFNKHISEVSWSDNHPFCFYTNAMRNQSEYGRFQTSWKKGTVMTTSHDS